MPQHTHAPTPIKKPGGALTALQHAAMQTASSSFPHIRSLHLPKEITTNLHLISSQLGCHPCLLTSEVSHPLSVELNVSPLPLTMTPYPTHSPQALPSLSSPGWGHHCASPKQHRLNKILSLTLQLHHLLIHEIENRTATEGTAFQKRSECCQMPRMGNMNTAVNFRRLLPLTLNYHCINCASTSLTQPPARNQVSLQLPMQTPTHRRRTFPVSAGSSALRTAHSGTKSRHHVPAGGPSPSADPASPPEAGQRAAPPHTMTGGGGTAAPPLCPAVSAACPEPQPPAALLCRASRRDAAAGPRRGPRGGCASPGPEAAAPAGGAADGPASSLGRSCQPGRAGPGPHGTGGEKPHPAAAPQPPPFLTSGWARRRPCPCSRSPAGSDHAPGGSPPSWMGGTRQPRRCGRRRGGTEGGGGRGAGRGVPAAAPCRPRQGEVPLPEPRAAPAAPTSAPAAPHGGRAARGSSRRGMTGSGAAFLQRGALLCLLGLGLFVYSPRWLFVYLFVWAPERWKHCLPVFLSGSWSGALQTGVMVLHCCGLCASVLGHQCHKTSFFSQVGIAHLLFKSHVLRSVAKDERALVSACSRDRIHLCSCLCMARKPA